jgi:hydroxymethylpyrimidine/phosphomethylpyrimidine kinase
MTRPCVLIFAGSDPSGGAGIQADIGSVGAMGAHALVLITALTVQDNDRVHEIYPVPARWLQQQAQALVDKIDIAAVKIGIIGNLANAAIIVDVIHSLRLRNPDLPVVLDPILSSGHGDALATDNAALMLAELIPLATLLTPNLPEAAILCAGDRRAEQQIDTLLQRGCRHVLLKGGHGADAQVVNRWYTEGASRSWSWPRLSGEFHGSGCTLAGAIAGALACGLPMEAALDVAQAFCQSTLEHAFAIADGQRIPNRHVVWNQDKIKESS